MSKIYLSSKGIKPTIDNSTIINNVISKAKDRDILVFPAGDFSIHKTLIQKDKILHWEGDFTNLNVALNVPALEIRCNRYPPMSYISGMNFINWYGLEDSNSRGVLISAIVKMEDCWISGFGGDGLVVSADLESINTNASGSIFRNLLISGNKGKAIYTQGGDANKCSFYDIDFRDNGDGIDDRSFLGNYFSGCMAHNNARNYKADGQYSTFVGCYSESGSLPEYLSGGATWFGGTPANGFELHGYAKVYLMAEKPID